MKVKKRSLVTFLIPSLGLPLGLINTKENRYEWRSCIFCLALFMSVFAYCYNPLGSTDLVRYFEYIDSLKTLNFSEALQTGIHADTTLVGFNIFCWLISKTGDYHLAPAITVFVIYYIGMYVTCSIGEDMEIDIKNIRLYIVFLLFAPPYCWVINNIRNIFSFTLVGYAVFRDCYKKKRDIITLLFYVVPVFFHSSALVIILLRLILMITEKLKNLSFSLILMVDPIITALYNTIGSISTNNSFISLIKNTVILAYKYLNDTSSSWGLIVQNSGYHKVTKFLYILLTLILCVLTIFISRRQRNESKVGYVVTKEEYSMVSFAFSIGLVTLACIPMLTPEYWRFATTVILFGAPIYFSVIKYCFDKIVLAFAKSIFLFIPVFIILWLYELKACEHAVILMQPFISSPLFVLLKDIINGI